MESLWIDRRGLVKGRGLHALIIGVSDYLFLPDAGQFPAAGRVTFGLSKVNIPATGAFRIAQWLQTSYWHPDVQVKTIRLLLSPSSTELAQPNFPELAKIANTQPRAMTTEVAQAMQDWKADCQGNPEDMALLYVAGHGVQWGSKDDAIVLLEDFSANPALFMDYTIDVGNTLRDMAGDDLPQTQFYFVDACRIQPDEFRNYTYAGRPLRLGSSFNGEDLRAAPIYYGACPQTAAKGHRGKGTYFAEALVDCLETYGRQGPMTNSSMPVARNYWHVSVAGLLANLQDRVAAIAKADNEKQEIVIGGNVRAAVFCASLTPPPVSVVVSVDPDSIATVTSAELWNSNRSEMIMKRLAPCLPKPLTLGSVPPGIYMLEFYSGAPSKVLARYAIHAQPPEWKEPITLS